MIDREYEPTKIQLYKSIDLCFHEYCSGVLFINSAISKVLL